MPLSERRPLTLAVVREHDELIGARSLLRCGLQHADEVVQPFEGGERLRPRRAGMVGDLVIVGEVAEDGGCPSDHLLDDESGVEVPQQHVRDRAKQDVGPVSVDPRLHRTTTLAPALVPLLDDLPQGEHE